MQALRTVEDQHRRDLKARDDRNAELHENVHAAHAQAGLAESRASQERTAREDAETEMGKLQNALEEVRRSAKDEIASLKSDNEFLARHDAESRREIERLRATLQAQAKRAVK